MVLGNQDLVGAHTLRLQVASGSHTQIHGFLGLVPRPMTKLHLYALFILAASVKMRLGTMPMVGPVMPQ
jgi:hypothetical protein